MLYRPATFQDLLLTIQVRFQLAKSTNFTLASLWLYRKIGVSTSSQNLIHFGNRKKYNSILPALRGKELNFSRRVWCEQYKPKKSYTRLKSNVNRLLIIFFITQIHRVRFVSVNGQVSRVKPEKKKILKKSWKNNFGNKILKKKCWEKKFWKIIWKKKFWKKNCEKEILKKVLTKKILEKLITKQKYSSPNFIATLISATLMRLQYISFYICDEKVKMKLGLLKHEILREFKTRKLI